MGSIKLLNDKLVKNFSFEEMACKDAERTLKLNVEAIEHLHRVQAFREWYNRAMNITSWYRTQEYNENCGGSPKSQHVKGLATDFYLPTEFDTWSNSRQKEFMKNIENKWIELCRKGFRDGGVGFYINRKNKFCHIDSRKKSGNPRGYSYWTD